MVRFVVIGSVYPPCTGCGSSVLLWAFAFSIWLCIAMLVCLGVTAASQVDLIHRIELDSGLFKRNSLCITEDWKNEVGVKVLFYIHLSVCYFITIIRIYGSWFLMKIW